jgi:hypothetical protein
MGSVSGGSDGSGNTTRTVKFAPYIEDQHQIFLSLTAAKTNAVVNASPYSGYVDIEVDDAFFSLGNTISSFSSIYDMFGKFMSGYDVDALWQKTFQDQIDSSNINENIEESIVEIDDYLIKDTLPKYSLMMRDANAIMSSSFIIGKATIEKERSRKIGKMIMENVSYLLPSIESGYYANLNWRRKLVTEYGIGMKFYYLVKTDIDDANRNMAAMDKFWAFTVMKFSVPALNTSRPGRSFQKSISPRKRSDISKALTVIQYTTQGASVGFQVAGPWGAVVGAAIGQHYGIASIFMEEGMAPGEAITVAGAYNSFIIGDAASALAWWTHSKIVSLFE